MRNAFMESTNSRTKKTNEAGSDCRVSRFGCSGNREHPALARPRGTMPEDLWPNLNATVTRLQQLYIGNHEEKLTAREHGFDRDFWAGSPSDCTTKLCRVHVKPRSTVFDPQQCATSLIPAGVEIVSRKIHLRETRGRRVAELERNFNDNTDVWSGTVDGTKWTGVSVFHLSVAVTPHAVRTGEGRETGTGYSKPKIQPNRRPRDVSWRQPPGGTWGEPEHLRHTGIGTNTRRWKQRRSTSLGHGVRTKLVSRNSHLNLESHVHAVTDATAASRMIAPRPTLTPPFDLSRSRRVDRCCELTTANCAMPREVGYCMLPDARESRVAERSEI